MHDLRGVDWDLADGGAEMTGRGRAGRCTEDAVSTSLFNLSGGEAATPTTIHFLYITNMFLGLDNAMASINIP